jgi:ABC transporter substrate binding protein
LRWTKYAGSDQSQCDAGGLHSAALTTYSDLQIRRPFHALSFFAHSTLAPRLRTQGPPHPTRQRPDVWVSAFTSRLLELGWIEDRNIKIDVRWAEGRNDRSAEIAAELARLKVDVIVTYSTEHTQIAKQATSIIPIVFALAADPVGSDLVASLARPGGNLTGLSAQNVELTGKRFELLREIVPRSGTSFARFFDSRARRSPSFQTARTKEWTPWVSWVRLPLRSPSTCPSSRSLCAILVRVKGT